MKKIKNIQLLQNIQKTLIFKKKKHSFVELLFLRKNYLDYIVINKNLILNIIKFIRTKNEIIDFIYSPLNRSLILINNKNCLIFIKLYKNNFYIRSCFNINFPIEYNDQKSLSINSIDRLLIVTNFLDFKYLLYFSNYKFHNSFRIKKNFFIINKLTYNYSFVLVDYLRYSKVFSIEGHKIKPYIKFLVSYKFQKYLEKVEKKIESNLSDSSFRVKKFKYGKSYLLCIFSKRNTILYNTFNLSKIKVNFPLKRITNYFKRTIVIDYALLKSKKFIFLVFISTEKFLFFSKIKKNNIVYDINTSFLDRISDKTNEIKFLPNSLLLFNAKFESSQIYRIISTGKLLKIINLKYCYESKNIEKVKTLYYNFKIKYVSKFRKNSFFVLCKCQRLMYLKFFKYSGKYVKVLTKTINQTPFDIGIVDSKLLGLPILIFFYNDNIKTFFFKKKSLKKIYFNQLIYNQKSHKIFEIKKSNFIIQITYRKVRIISSVKFLTINEWKYFRSAKIIDSFLIENERIYIYIITTNNLLFKLKIDNDYNLIWVGKYIIKTNYLKNVKGVSILNTKNKIKNIFFFSKKDRFIKCFELSKKHDLKLVRILSQSEKIKSLIILINESSYVLISNLEKGIFCVNIIDPIKLFIKRVKKIFLSDFNIRIYTNQKDIFLIGRKVWKVKNILNYIKIKVFCRKTVLKFFSDDIFVLVYKDKKIFVYKKISNFSNIHIYFKTDQIVRSFNAVLIKKIFLFLIKSLNQSIDSNNLIEIKKVNFFKKYEAFEKIFFTSFDLYIQKKKYLLSKNIKKFKLLDLFSLKKTIIFKILNQVCKLNKNILIVPFCFNYNSSHIQKDKTFYINEKLPISTKIYIFSIIKSKVFNNSNGGKKFMKFNLTYIKIFDLFSTINIDEKLIIFKKIFDNRYLCVFENVILIVEFNNKKINKKTFLVLSNKNTDRIKVNKNFLFIIDFCGIIKIIYLDWKTKNLINLLNFIIPYQKSLINILNPFTFFITTNKKNLIVGFIDLKVYKNFQENYGINNSDCFLEVLELKNYSEISLFKTSHKSLKMNNFKFFKIVI